MTMNYTSLVATKGTAGSIANWVNYSRLDLATILDEAQAEIYRLLRVREMRKVAVFTLAVGACSAPAPTGYLDPIGDMLAPTLNLKLKHRLESDVLAGRMYDTSSSGTLGSNPLTTVSGSSLVTVYWPTHGFNEGSSFVMSGASAVGGLTLNGTFPIYDVTDVDNFRIDAGESNVATSSATGGGSAIAYSCNNLIAAYPAIWAMWDERFQFDAAFDTQTTCQLHYFRKLPLLSATNLTNFLTDRYPRMLRVACMAAAADYMKDQTQYQKHFSMLQSIIGAVAQQDDLQYRGAEIPLENP